MVEILNDPHVKAAVRHAEIGDQICNILGAQLLICTKTWDTMDEVQRKICIRHIVLQVESEQELDDRLRRDLGMDCFCINWHLPEPSDKTGDEARMLARALGVLISKNGALVMIMTANGSF